MFINNLLRRWPGSARAEADQPRAPLPVPVPELLPRWRGFNLLEKFFLEKNEPYRERDFAMAAEWGFNFMRLPCCYRHWINGQDWFSIDARKLKDIDRALAYGE